MKIMNIAITYKWFYCVIIQNRFSTIFFKCCGKTKVEIRNKIVEYVQYKQEQEIKKLCCKFKVIFRPQIATANKIQRVIESNDA